MDGVRFRRPDGQAIYFDRDSQLFRLAVDLEDPKSVAQPFDSARGKPVPLPIKGFVQAEYRRQFDMMPNGREFLVLIPVEGN